MDSTEWKCDVKTQYKLFKYKLLRNEVECNEICRSMPKSFEKQFLHFARYLNLEIGISVQECQAVGEVISSIFSCHSILT